MIVLYVDESGDFEDPEDTFVLAGIAVPETEIAPVGRRLAQVVKAFAGAENAELELHAQHLRAGKGPWRRQPREVRQGVLDTVANYLGNKSQDKGFCLYGVVRAPEAVTGKHFSLDLCYEELLARFTQALLRRREDVGDHMGLVVADEAKYEKRIQPIADGWRQRGGRLARLSRLAEVPLFADSQSSRLLQGADFVAHALYRYYEAGDPSLVGPLLPAFDSDGGVKHGLFHLVTGHRTCPCPACVSRSTARAATSTTPKTSRAKG